MALEWGWGGGSKSFLFLNQNLLVIPPTIKSVTPKSDGFVLTPRPTQFLLQKDVPCSWQSIFRFGRGVGLLHIFATLCLTKRIIEHCIDIMWQDVTDVPFVAYCWNIFPSLHESSCHPQPSNTFHYGQERSNDIK